MTMEKAKLCVIAFDAADVIATSGPYSHENIANTDLFYIYGIGSDGFAPTGETFLIHNGGNDVTGDFELSFYHIGNSQATYDNGGFKLLADVEQNPLGTYAGIEDGVYSYGKQKSEVPDSTNYLDGFKRIQ